MRDRFTAIFLLSALAILSGCATTPVLVAQIQAGPGSGNSPLITFRGRCDGSAAAVVSGKYLATASDETDNATEENTIALYDPIKGGTAIVTFPLNHALGLPEDGKRSAKEVDIEAAALLGKRIFWIGSHSLSKEGKERPARYQLFATQEKPTNSRHLEVVGKSYTDLKAEMLADPNLAPVLTSAAKKTPEEPGGWNIEGMSATPDNHLLIAFRNPVIDGKYALLVPLLNPNAVVEGREKAKFGPAIKLDVSGGNATAAAELGIRDIAWWSERKKYVVLAGSYKAGEDTTTAYRLLLWDGKGKPVVVKPDSDLSSLHAPEAVFIQPGKKNQVLVLSDDGSLDGCKAKADADRVFHGEWVSVSVH